MTEEHLCDFHENAGALFKEFREKCGRLNELNAEFVEANEHGKALYQEYLTHQNTKVSSLGNELTELRSEIQALQAKLLDLTIEHLIGPEKYDA